jgi:hypothetical protein
VTTVSHLAGGYFLVGCERSGSTLLQALLAGHSRIFSFPESHFFCRSIPRRRILRLLALARTGPAKRALREVAGNVGLEGKAPLVPTRSPFLSSYSRAFCTLLATATLNQGKDIWLEKTPHHLYYIPIIRRMVRGARFIHLLRDGRDVAASIQDASLQDTDYWGHWTISSLAETWNRAMQASLFYRWASDHFLMCYEALICNPIAELERLCRFMEVDFETDMMVYQDRASQVAGWMAGRPWMSNLHEPIKNTSGVKFGKLFSADQQAQLEEMLLGGGEVKRLLDSSEVSLNVSVSRSS